MLTEFLRCKIHLAQVTEANVAYEGSLTLDRDLMDAAGLERHQRVLVANATNGSRLETYVIEGERGSGVVCLNGAAAHHGQPGDRVIVMAFCALTAEQAAVHEPVVVRVAEGNVPLVGAAESHGAPVLAARALK